MDYPLGMLFLLAILVLIVVGIFGSVLCFKKKKKLGLSLIFSVIIIFVLGFLYMLGIAAQASYPMGPH